MSKPFWMLAGVLGIGLTLAIAASQSGKSRPVEELIPGNTVILVGNDGALKHQAAWEETAACEAIYDSGMVKVWEKLLEYVVQQAGAQGSSEIEEAIKHLDAHGATLSIALPMGEGPPIPQFTVVLHNAAMYEPMLSGMIRNFGGIVGAQFEQQDVSGRRVTSALVPNSPGIEVGIWAEAEHLLVVAGVDAVNGGMSVAVGDAPNLTSSSQWRKYNYNTEGFETTSVAWIDFESVRNRFERMPVPSPGGKTVGELLRVLGLHNLNTVAHQCGYKGKSLWSETAIEVDGPRTGLLALSDQEPMTLADLPPLPANTNGFNATRLDTSAMWDSLIEIVRGGAAFGPPQVADQIEDVLGNLPQIVGFDPRTDLLDAFGDVICIFADPDQGFLGTGMGVMVKVENAKKVQATIDQLVQLGEQASRGEFRVHRSEKHGRELILFEFGSLQIGALTVDDGWLIAGLMPQSVEAALMRIDGNLDTWKPTSAQAQALQSLPQSFTSITIGDPRVSWHALSKLAPVILSGAQVALKEQRILPRDARLPVTMADFPPAELVVRSLFPNVTVATSDEAGIHVTSRKSLPGIPLIGGIGEGNGLVTAAIGTSLLLPAVQQVCTAARRTQSRNNMKQLGLALHNYHDVNQSFPAGTHPNEKLKPDERLSWLTSILPYIDQSNLYNTIDLEEAWDDEANEQSADTLVQVYLNPGRAASDVGPGETHYVGIAGLGKDGPMLPARSKRAGIFAINRKTRIRDITDGTSNTLMTSEASDNYGPWISGGSATIRSLTKKPYINGPDGIGGPFPGGVHVGLADGSVRFVSENIDPEAFEHLSTIAGGEVIPGF